MSEHGIETILDSPGVGQNLADHPLLWLLWATKPEVELERFVPNSQLLVRYTAEGSPLHNDMIVYLSAAAGKGRNMGGKHGDLVGLGAGLGLNLALSKGELRLRSSDYRDHPYLDYNLLDHEEDLRRYRDGVRQVVSLEEHPAIAAMIQERVYPEDSNLESDEALNLWMKRHVGTGHHISCTAKMGPSSDPMAVVDQYGKLYGADGLRVADASIMPECVRANINVTVLMIGERIADFIKQGR